MGEERKEGSGKRDQKSRLSGEDMSGVLRVAKSSVWQAVNEQEEAEGKSKRKGDLGQLLGLVCL